MSKRWMEDLIDRVPDMISEAQEAKDVFDAVSAEVEPLLDNRRPEKIRQAISVLRDTAKIVSLTSELHDAEKITDLSPARLAARAKKSDALLELFAAVSPILVEARAFAVEKRAEILDDEMQLFAKWGAEHRPTSIVSSLTEFERLIGQMETAIVRHSGSLLRVYPSLLDVFFKPRPAAPPLDESDPTRVDPRIRASRLGAAETARQEAWEAGRPARIARGRKATSARARAALPLRAAVVPDPFDGIQELHDGRQF